MPLTPFTGLITGATLNSNMDDSTSTISANALVGHKDQNVFIRLASLPNATDISLRSVAFTMQDDMEIRTMFLRITDTGANSARAILTVDNGDATFLGDNTVSIFLLTAAGTTDSRPTFLDLRPTTATRIRLLKGVRYRLEISNTSGATITGPLQACLQLRTVRRAA